MNARRLTVIALLMCVNAGGPVLAGSMHEGMKQVHRFKPTAPVDVRWLSDGADGRVEVSVVAGVDHVGMQLRLVVPGAGAPLTAVLPAAAAGEIQAVSWTLDRPSTRPPRLSVEVDTGDGVMAKQIQPPRSTGKRRGAAAPATTAPERPLSTPGATAGSSAADSEERLISLPAEVSIRRADD